MQELRDPITEWSEAIKSRMTSVVGTLCLLAFVLCLVAPIFDPIIKRLKRQQYALYPNYEELAERDMKPIRIFLWVIAALGWLCMALALAIS